MNTFKQKYISVFIILSMLLLQIPVLAEAELGTEENPYLITNASQLQDIGNNLFAYYRLANDIDMSYTYFEPIGNEGDGAFCGTLDGNGFTIKNLTLEKEGNKYVGLVGCLEGTIKNVKLDNVTVNGQSARYVGAIAGYVGETAVVDNCEAISGTVTGSYVMVDFSIGGLIGSNKGTLQNSKNGAEVEYISSDSNKYVGGITGYNTGTIDNCENNGDVKSGYYGGGIAGYNASGTISGCTNSREVSATSSHRYGGGIAGFNDQGTIDNCENNGDVKSGYYGGGIAGYNYRGTISSCTNSGEVSATSTATSYSYDCYGGGIAGCNVSGTISGCTNSGEVTTAYSYDCYGGGIAGKNLGMISGCTNSGDVTATAYKSYCYGGGIAGYNTSGTISGCTNSGGVTATAYNYCYGGGIAGYSYKTQNCFNSARIVLYNDKGGSYGGGIDASGNAYNCVNTGSVIHTGATTSTYTYDIAPYVYNLYTKSSKINIRQNITTSIPIELYGYDKDLKWTSADESVAVVDSKGNVTGTGAGETIITAETEFGITTSTTVVAAAESIGADIVSISKSTARLRPSETVQLSAEVTPAGAVNPITWRSGDTSIATVDETGLVTAVKTGVTAITARIGSGRMFNCVINVVSEDIRVDVQSVTINESEITLAPGDAAALNAAASPENATDSDIIYTSDNDAVAEVNSQGIVTAKSAGVAVIKAQTANGCYDECVISVVAADSSSIVLKAENALSGDMAQVKAAIVKNPGIASYKIAINYDNSVLTPISITPNSDFKGTFTSNIDDENKTNIQAVWYSDTDIDINADLFTITFKVSEDAQSGGLFPITSEYNAENIRNTSGNMFALYSQNASIKIEEPLPGDIYEDNSVTVHDLTLISRYVTHLEKFTKRQLTAADVNNDGNVDIKDVVRMSQYLVGWGGIELLSLYHDESIPDISIGNVAVDNNGIAEIPVSVNNNTGMAGFVFELEYNRDEVEILEITPSEKLSENMKTNLGQTDDEGLFVSWYQSGNMSESGELFTIKARYMGETVSPISIKYAENNICDNDEENVIPEYKNGFIMSDSFIKTDEKLENNTYTSTLYFDDTFKEQSANAIIALYDENNAVIGLRSTETAVKSGVQTVCIPFEATEYNKYRLFIWDSMNSMRPIVK